MTVNWKIHRRKRPLHNKGIVLESTWMALGKPRKISINFAGPLFLFSTKRGEHNLFSLSAFFSITTTVSKHMQRNFIVSLSYVTHVFPLNVLVSVRYLHMQRQSPWRSSVYMEWEEGVGICGTHDLLLWVTDHTDACTWLGSCWISPYTVRS